jgi:hypothetical protein
MNSTLNQLHRPPGIPLAALAAALDATSLAVRDEGSRLIVVHPSGRTTVDVLPMTEASLDDAAPFAAVRVRTVLEGEVAASLTAPGQLSSLNAFAALGALTAGDDGVYVGSRLTVDTHENAWAVHLPLLLAAVLHGAPAPLGALAHALGQGGAAGEPSAWGAADFASVARVLAPVCSCNAGGRGFTAGFALERGQGSAGAGDRATALWQLRADQPHPAAGGGLFCLLELPHRFHDAAALEAAAERLNRLEMEARDLPPHFGAWCRSQYSGLLAYVSFLPNELHAAAGIATNLSIWACARAQWAHRTLRSEAVSR